MGEARDKSAAKRVRNDREHNGDCSGSPLRGTRRRGCRGNDYVDLEVYQLFGKCIKPLKLALCASAHDRSIVTLGVTKRPKSFDKRFHEAPVVWHAQFKVTDSPYLGGLSCRE